MRRLLTAFVDDEAGGSAIQYGLFAALVILTVVPAVVAMSESGLKESLMYVVDCGLNRTSC